MTLVRDVALLADVAADDRVEVAPLSYTVDDLPEDALVPANEERVEVELLPKLADDARPAVLAELAR